jgi:hypothetical protein
LVVVVVLITTLSRDKATFEGGVLQQLPMLTSLGVLIRRAPTVAA